MSEKVCCFIGKQEVTSDELKYVRTSLNEEIIQANKDVYTTFIACFYSGLNVLFAELVMEQKNTHLNLFLEATVLNHPSTKISSVSDAILQGYYAFRFHQQKYDGQGHKR